MDLIHWTEVLGILDDLLNEISVDVSKLKIMCILRFFVALLRNCQNKRYFLSLDVSS